MQALTRIVLGPAWQGISLVALCYLLPFLSLFALVIEVFITLRQGIVKGLIVGVGGTICGVLAEFLLSGFFIELNVTALTQALYWALFLALPLWGFAALLRQTVSLQYTLQVMTLVFMGLFVFSFFEQISFFPRVIHNVINDNILKITAGQKITQDIQLINQFVIYLLEIVFIYTTYVFLIMMGRAWQSYIFMPKEFSKEFQMLRPGSFITLSLASLLLMEIIFSNSILSNGMILLILSGILLIGAIWLSITGLAYIHWVIAEYNIPVRVLALFYLSLCLPIISSIVFIMLLLIGLVDGFKDLRTITLRFLNPKV